MAKSQHNMETLIISTINKAFCLCSPIKQKSNYVPVQQNARKEQIPLD